MNRKHVIFRTFCYIHKRLTFLSRLKVLFIFFSSVLHVCGNRCVAHPVGRWDDESRWASSAPASCTLCSNKNVHFIFFGITQSKIKWFELFLVHRILKKFHVSDNYPVHHTLKNVTTVQVCTLCKAELMHLIKFPLLPSETGCILNTRLLNHMTKKLQASKIVKCPPYVCTRNVKTGWFSTEIHVFKKIKAGRFLLGTV